ncbi:hypothetical protein YWS52_04820 [Chitiniphilus shinanonensis]
MSRQQVLHRFSEGAAAWLVGGVAAGVAVSLHGAVADVAAALGVVALIAGGWRFGLGLHAWRRALRSHDGRCARCGGATEFCPTNCYVRYYRCPHCDLG